MDTLPFVENRSPRCPRHVPLTLLSSGNEWWSWCGAVVPRRSCRESLSPSAQSIRNWVLQSGGIEESGRPVALTSAEREALLRLRRENRKLQEEREILAKAAAWFARETGSIPSRSSDS